MRLAVVCAVGAALLGAASPAAAHTRPSDLPARQLAQARLATAKYVNDLDAAKRDGYQLLTQHVSGMGWHFLDPSVTGFDVRRPAALVYERHGDTWQLGALEWVFSKKPARAPLKGATYGSFPAACHYDDGTFVESATATCAPTHGTARFTLWHPRLVTLHVWLWYPNPDGLYASMNPLVDAFAA